MSYIDKKNMRIALVTCLDNQYIYIWDALFGAKELKYPLNKLKNIKPGDFVRYRQTADFNEVQCDQNIFKEDLFALPVIKKRGLNGVYFKIKTNFVFSPKNYRPYQDCVDKVENCYGMAFSPDFLKVAMFLKHSFKPNVVYEGFICRIPKHCDSLILKVKTIFCIMLSQKEPIHEVVDQAIIDQVLQDIPWKEDFSTVKNNLDEVDDDLNDDPTGLGKLNYVSCNNFLDNDNNNSDFNYPNYNKTCFYQKHSKNSYNKQLTHQEDIFPSDNNNDFLKNNNSLSNSYLKQSQTNLLRPNEHQNTNLKKECFTDVFEMSQKQHYSLKEDEEFAKKLQNEFNNPSNFSTDLKNENNNIGIIVRLEDNYAVIWSLSNELVCASAASPAKNMPLGTWIYFKYFDDFSNIENGLIKKSAYSIDEIEPKRLTYEFQNTVKCQAFVHCLPEISNEYFLMTTDDVLGIVLCSRDPFLINCFKQNLEVEVFTIYVENYQKISKWIAVAVNVENNAWRKLHGLPKRIDALANLAISYKKPKEESFFRNESLSADIFAQQYNVPKDWIGPIYINEQTIEDVLGLVVEHENNEKTSVIHTAFGLARIPIKLLLGTWLRLTIEKDMNLDKNSYTTVLDSSSHCYIVNKSKKIFPPMSTRVVMVDGEERLLLCGKVVAIAGGYFENEYLGRVNDFKNCVNFNRNMSLPQNGFLVELAFMCRSKTNSRFWNIVKFHGPAIKLSLPLELSVYSNEVGRTCNDLQYIYEDSCYVSNSKNLKFNQELRKQNKDTVDKKEAKNCDDLIFVNNCNASTSSISNEPFNFNKSINNECENMTISDKKWSFGNENEEKKNNINNLRIYKPNLSGQKWNGMCIIIRQNEDFALAYSKKFRIILIKAESFQNFDSFYNTCKPANWIYGTIVRILQEENMFYEYKFIMTSPIEVCSKTNVPKTRLLNNFIQVNIFCKFDEKTVKRVSEESSKLIVTTDFGNVLIFDFDYERQKFKDTSQFLWITNISETHGCYWKVVVHDFYSENIQQQHLLEKNNDLLCFEETISQNEKTSTLKYTDFVSKLVGDFNLLDKKNNSTKQKKIELSLANIAAEELKDKEKQKIINKADLLNSNTIQLSKFDCIDVDSKYFLNDRQDKINNFLKLNVNTEDKDEILETCSENKQNLNNSRSTLFFKATDGINNNLNNKKNNLNLKNLSFNDSVSAINNFDSKTKEIDKFFLVDDYSFDESDNENKMIDEEQSDN